MRRKNTFYKATALAMTSVLTLGAPVIAHAENTEGTDLSDEGYPEINPEIPKSQLWKTRNLKYGFLPIRDRILIFRL